MVGVQQEAGIRSYRQKAKSDLIRIHSDSTIVCCQLLCLTSKSHKRGGPLAQRNVSCTAAHP